MPVSDTKPQSDELATLQEAGKVSIDGVVMSYQKRVASRIVIGFFEDAADTSWFDQVCSAEDFSEIRVVGAPDSLTSCRLEAFLGKLAGSSVVTGLEVSICGAQAGCAALVAWSHLFRDPVVLAIDPSDTLIETVSSAFETVPTVYVFYDPLITPKPTGRLNDRGAKWLKCIASGGDSVNAIWRMRLLQAIFPAALRGELAPVFFYHAMRARKDYRFYRIGMETALAARGKAHRVNAFRALFRARKAASTNSIQFERLRDRAEHQRPDQPGSWARLRHPAGNAPDWPAEGGNVWMLQKEANRLRYLSDRWHGVTMGYTEQYGITLAETPDQALGFLGFGDGLQVERPLPRRFPWHVTDARLDGSLPACGPISEATLVCEQSYALHEGLFTILALSQTQSGITASEALRGSAGYDALVAQVNAGQSALGKWNKKLSIDRIRLSLLTGAPNTTECEAAAHYFEVARSLKNDLVELTGQNTPPVIVVIPQSGTRTDGTSEISLAESRFDLDGLGLNAVVPTPAYPWPLMADTPATPAPEAALIMDELSALAVRERQHGRAWHCPMLQLASLEGRTVRAQFSSMDGLVLEDVPHGFHLLGPDAVPSITSATVFSDSEIRLELDADISTDDLQLAYAWGHRSTSLDASHSANHGALRDKWRHKSWAVPSRFLSRFALPARVPVHPAN